MPTRYHVYITDRPAAERTSDNTSPWSVPELPMTKKELMDDLADHEASDIEWWGDRDFAATITDPQTNERTRYLFVLHRLPARP